MNEELVKGSGCLHAEGWEWNLHITYLSLSGLPKPHRMSLKVEGTARSSHRSRAHVWTGTICLSPLSGDPFLSLMLSCADISRSPYLDCDSVSICLCKPLGRVCVFLFVPHLRYYQHNLISTGSDGLFWDMLKFLQDRTLDNKCMWPLTHLKLVDYQAHPVISWSSYIHLFVRSRAIVNLSILLRTMS